MKHPILLCLIINFFSALEINAQSETWYIRRDPPEPWTWAPILNTNITEMDEAFGAGSWESGYYASVDAEEVFDAGTCFVFMEGGDDHADEFNNFLTTNLTLIEDWVFNGGNLFLNAAPNEGTSINCGFGGVTIVYPSFISDAVAVDLLHPIFNGPYTPVGSAWSGTSFTHTEITGPDLTPLITESFTDRIACAEKNWGAGKVMFGGMTVTSWHSPAPEAVNLRLNIFKYLSSYAFLDFSYADSTFCSYEDVSLLPIFATGADTGTFICETEGLDLDSITGEINIGNSLPGTYTIINAIIDATCASDSSNYTITIYEPAEAVASEDVSICSGSTATISASGGVTYEWIPVTYLTDPTSATTDVVNPLTDMEYAVVTTDIHGCNDTDYVNVNLYPDPIIDAGEDVSIPLGGYIVLNASGATTYLWNEDPTLSAFDISNPTASPQDTTTYVVYGTDANGCIGFDSVTVNVIIEPGIHAPNAFSPNGDGNNEFFTPVLLACNLIDFTIYNRWGEVVFVSTDINNGWNGTYNNEEAPLGVYTVIISAESIYGETIFAHENVTLVR